MTAVKWRRTSGLTPIQIPLAGIVGIAVGGAVLFFGVLVAIVLAVVRKKHRQEEARIAKLEDGARFAPAVRSTDQRTISHEKQPAPSSNFAQNPFMPLGSHVPRHNWTGGDGLHNSAGPKSRRPSPQKPLFMISGMRDSWPLVSNIPMSFIPKQSSSNIMLSNVAAPGYEIPSNPMRPKRTLSRRTTVSVPRDNARTRSASSERYSPSKSPRRMMPHRRSTSENHLSTILRSTSERLKASNRAALTRTLTTVDREFDRPPLQRLSSSFQVKIPTESREHLVESDSESVTSSVYDLARSLSTNNLSPKKSAKKSTPERKSPVSSAESEDSLCADATPDLVIPAQLASPSKRDPKGAQRHRMRISSGTTRNLSTSAISDNGLSVPPGQQVNMRRSMSLSTPRQDNISGDPFFSEVRSAKPIIPSGQMQFPRPLYIRKATFGQVSVSGRPRSSVNVLADISGNAQVVQNKPTPSLHSASPVSIRSDQNPFQWAPQEALQTRSNQSSPTRRRGHKRSKVVRISQLPRPCSVAVVPEEPDEDGSPYRFQAPSTSSVNVDEPMKSPTPVAVSLNEPRLAERPPSSAVFNPTLNAYDLSSRSRDNSPTLGMEEIYAMYSSPTLGANYYTESSDASEDEFFAKKSISQSHKHSSSPRNSRTYSNELFLFPGAPTSGKLVSFPDSELSLEERIIAPPSVSPRPLPSITTIFAPPSGPKQSTSPTSSQITLPVPGHLNGPRAEPPKSKASAPSHNSLQTSIGMLRRMNSEVSQLSPSPSEIQFAAMPGRVSMANFASFTAESSPTEDQEERGRTRGSKHYLGLGDVSAFPYPSSSSQVRSPHRPRRSVDHRESTRIYKERRKQRIEGIENDIANGMINELTPVKEMSSPATSTTKVLGPKISPSRFVAVKDLNVYAEQMKRFPDRTEDLRASEQEADADDEEEDQQMRSLSRWSDAMAKPANHVIRRESKMEHPSPKSPPAWGWGLGIMYGGLGSNDKNSNTQDSGAGKYEILVEGKENERVGGNIRPLSLGLYDKDGFLKGSPERGGLEGEKLRSKTRN